MRPFSIAGGHLLAAATVSAQPVDVCAHAGGVHCTEFLNQARFDQRDYLSTIDYWATKNSL